MGQYDEIVERQRQKIAAEDWAAKVKAIHAHSLNSMYYDNRPEDTEDGKSFLAEVIRVCGLKAKFPYNEETGRMDLGKD